MSEHPANPQLEQGHPEDEALAGRLRDLLVLPAPPPQLDARILAAARARAAEVARAPARPAGGTGPTRLRPLFRRSLAWAAAAMLLAGFLGLTLQVATPRARPYPDLQAQPLVRLSALGDAVVSGAEGAFGAAGRPKRAPSYVSSGEPLSVAPGGFLELTLACGTRLVLDGGTQATLGFGARERRLHLARGRLYAQVVKVGSTPERRPLVIESAGGRTRVLGTELTVKASSQRSQVTVREGTVRLESPRGQTLVSASQSGLLAPRLAPRSRTLTSVERQFRWIGRIQQGPRHPCEKPFGGVVSEDEAAIGTLVARGPDGRSQPLRLAEQAVNSVVAHGIATTTVRFAFANDGPQDLEGTFRFALPQRASISRYAVSIAGELVEGRVVERERARAIYQEEKERLEAPALLEWSRGSAFTAKVFPIEAGRLKRIEVSYVELLGERSGISRLVLPLVSADAAVRPPDRLSLAIHLRGPEARAPLRCPSHYLLDRAEEGGRVVRLEAEGLRPRNDLVLELARPGAPPLEGYLEPNPASRTLGVELATALIKLRPELGWAEAAASRGPLAVVCDVSRSQAGTLREIQLELLEGLLDAWPGELRVFLADVDTRELLPGGGRDPSRPERLLTALWRAEPRGALDLARAFVRVGHALPPDAGATVVYLGDGVASAGLREDHQVAAAFARALPPETVRRFVAVGLGSELNESLLERLARERGGVLIGLRPGDDLGSKLEAVQTACREPLLSQVQVRLDIDGLVESAPRRPRNLRGGETLNVHARLLGGAREGFVTISGLIGGRAFERRRKLRLQPLPEGERLASLWARQSVEDLLEEGPPAREAVIDLALRYGIVTPHTSLLVLDEAGFQRHAIARRRAVDAGLAALAQAAREHIRGGRPQAARAALQAMLRKQPDSAEAARLLRELEGLGGRESSPWDGDTLVLEVPEGASAAERLAGEVDALFAKVERLTEARDVEALVTTFQELRRRRRAYQDLNPPAGRERLDAWNRRLASFGETQLSSELQTDVQEGNQLLRELSAATRSGDAVAAARGLKRMEQLTARMRKEERKVFHRNADALEKRALALANRAERLGTPPAPRRKQGFLQRGSSLEPPRGGASGTPADRRDDAGRGPGRPDGAKAVPPVSDYELSSGGTGLEVTELGVELGELPLRGASSASAGRVGDGGGNRPTPAPSQPPSLPGTSREVWRERRPPEPEKLEELKPTGELGQQAGKYAYVESDDTHGEPREPREPQEPQERIAFATALAAPDSDGDGAAARSQPRQLGTFYRPNGDGREDRGIARDEAIEDATRALESLASSQFLLREGDAPELGKPESGEHDPYPTRLALIDGTRGAGTRLGYTFEKEQGSSEGKARSSPPSATTGDRFWLRHRADARGVAPSAETTVVAGRILRVEPTLSQLIEALHAASPTQRPALFDRLLALAHDLGAEPAQAIELLTALLRYAPERLELHELLGDAYLALDRRTAALRAYSGMVEAQPDLAEAHARYGRALLRLGLARRALLELDEAVRLQPGADAYRAERERLARELSSGSALRTRRSRRRVAVSPPASVTAKARWKRP